MASELFARDAISITPDLTAWLGLRTTRLHRDSVRSDGSQPTSYRQNLTSPAFALSYAFAPRQTVYVSWGRGAESEIAPNRARYTNAGEALPSLMSRQIELGSKWSGAVAARSN